MSKPKPLTPKALGKIARDWEARLAADDGTDPARADAIRRAMLSAQGRARAAERGQP